MSRKELPQMLTIAQAAEAYGCAEKTIRRRISDGSLLSYRVGPRLIRVDRDSLLALARPMAGAA
jgi:excisionase family DNA binding protein